MEWLKELFDKILSIFPQIYILTPYEAGIRITLGKRVKAKSAGWYLIWPLFQRFVWQEIQPQIIDLRNQSIRTIDGHELIVSGAIQYKIVDIKNSILNVQNVDKAVQTTCLGMVVDFMTTKTMRECQNLENLKTEILRGLRIASKGWGLKIEKIFITDLGKTRNIRLLSNEDD